MIGPNVLGHRDVYAKRLKPLLNNITKQKHHDKYRAQARTETRREVKSKESKQSASFEGEKELDSMASKVCFVQNNTLFTFLIHSY
jgi:hypothetical protein